MDGVRTLPGAPPRRGSFQEDIDLSLAGTSPSKNGTTSISAAIQADNNAVSNNHALSVTSASIDLDDDDDAMLTDDDPGFMKSASASRRNSMMPLTASQPRPSLTQSPPTDGEVIEVNQNAFQLPLDPASRGKLKNRYIMPDGSVINGKGLGRGRPGVKRGPRKSALSREITETGSDAAVAASTPSPAPHAKQISTKRKRKDSDVIKADDEEDDEEEEDDDLDDFSRESTPEYNPAAATHTRSGRQTQKPAPIITQVMSTASPSTKRPAITPSTSSPSIKKHPKIKPKVYRGREQFALCEHCLRQHGPPGNVIVFCDACNKCWHQRCHDPRIPKEVVEDTKAEWFCTACDKILHPKRKTKALPKPTAHIAQSTPPPTIVTNAMSIAAKAIPRYGLPLVPGMSLTLAQRKDYLNSLAKERLIEIILQAANLAPNMPIFETPLHLTPQFLPGQPYPIFVQPQPPTQTPPQLQSQPQPQPQSETSQPDNQLHPSTTPQPFNMSVASMPPPPPPSQLPPHLRAQFTSSVAASGHMPPQPASSSSSVPTISDSPSTSTPHVQPLFSASNPLSTPAPTNTNTNTTNNRPIYTHPTAGTPTKPNTQPPPPVLPSGPSTTNPDPDADEEDEGYYDDFDEMALLYPKPGQGAYDLAMPPESSDLGIMLEGSDCVTFSHVVY